MTEDEALELASAAGIKLASVLNLCSDRESIFSAVDQCLRELSLTGLWGTANRLPSGMLWQAAGEWLQHGALLHQARFKPRGYAGDDEMLRRICENWRCDHPLGRILDDYFQAHAAPQAVRNRTRMISDATSDLVRRTACPVRIVSVGSGPALDMLWAAQAVAEQDRARMQATLLDLDPLALEQATFRLASILPLQNISARRENLYRLARSPNAAELLDADLIACTGFFDYLNDKDAIALLARFWQELRPGGRLVVFNFAPHNPSRALMEWIGNWYLVYRDEAAMQRLAVDAGIPDQAFQIGAEQEGIDLFIDAVKPGGP